jgi:periplasmic protein TonB
VSRITNSKFESLGQGYAPKLLLPPSVNYSLLRSLMGNLWDVLFPRKLPRNLITSPPVRVKEVWGEYNNYRRTGTYGSVIVHAVGLAVLIGGTMLGRQKVQPARPQPEHVVLIAPPPEDITPLPPSKTEVAGGGGGGDRDILPAPKGKLPKAAMEQITPPQIIVRNERPKLTAEPTVVVPPQVQLAQNPMPNLGLPVAAMPSGPPSNGTGAKGGIGSGSGGGIGSGTGPGVGPGRGGGIGGGVFRVGGGISAPRPVETPDPAYTDEARRAKHQGVCVLGLIVDADGHPRDIRVVRGLGMGLDQKAIDAVRQWRFDPALKDGKPVAVQISVEVSFRLY